MILDRRDTAVRELMDDPAADPAALARTYRAFGPLNAVVAGWRRCYRDRVAPLLSPHRVSTLLDVGCGGGDVARALRRWAEQDGYRLAVTGIDPDGRALAYATGRPVPPGVCFRAAHTADLVAAGEQFDVVVSNHLLHHLDEDELAGVLADSEQLAGRMVLHNDLRRSRGAYLLFAAASLPLATRTFVHTDGLISIRRSHTLAELRALAPARWRVESLRAYRLLLVLDRGSQGG